ncbi:MAG: 50S ribosomal protein L24 [Candidatus Pacebacteria bacterium]|nr:50S ribosomal protein L24 [Candidatus Paceibacterota bacterium]MDD2757330.1 50S ribosomal protein L24 [Candidatus Paceibacterota bacterium]MDD3283472.1 50S ribosomal protein L24 [Candidatus Paceibacterota bacterium]MDD3969672.1 50S ribosomal protein L24 [Candidatus Paceibacterota bacterium]MDD4737902.1 50S ribosomal protein L24 [Candidatus Paceibacterota bacterium]
MKIKKNDQVLIIAGNDKGKKGKVLRSFPLKERVVIEGIALVKKNIKPKKSGQKGQIASVPRAISVSNVNLICSKCGKPTRVGYEIIDKKKYRVCKKCGAKN